MAMTILSATIVSLAVLIPCYLLADGDVDSDIELIGISSALEDEYYMIAPVVAFLMNLALQLYIIYLFVRSS